MSDPVLDEERDVAVSMQVETDASLVAQVAAALDERDAPLVRRLLGEQHPADIADILEQLNADQLTRVANLAADVLTGEVLSEIEADTREILVGELDAGQLAAAVTDLDSDDVIEVVEELEPDVRDAVLAELSETDREAVETSLAFDEDTAGRLMQREFVAAPEFWTVGHVIDHMREQADELPDIFHEVYVVDPGFRPVGTVHISSLMRAGRAMKLADLMVRPQTLIRPETDQEEAAYLFQKYHLFSAPVIDESGRLSGMLTIDDMVDVIQDENKEDMLALAGVNEAGLADTVLRTVRARAPWLLVNLATAILASGVIALFEGAIDAIVALAVLMPIVASMGGNAGTQSLAVAVRAMASRDLTSANTSRVVWRELATGLVNGLLFAVVMAIVAVIWFQDLRLAGVIAVAMVLNLAFAGLAGILIPLGLQRAGADPAVASSVFVTTVTDVVGFWAFLGLATLILL
jgi:magnesium transporter